MRPVVGQHVKVYLGGIAVSVQVAARKMRLHPGAAQRGRKGIEFFYMRVLGTAQGGQVTHIAKIFWVMRAAVRGI